MTATWIDVFALEDLPPGATRTVKHDGLQIAVFRTEDDAIYAIDNRCPHEG